LPVKSASQLEPRHNLRAKSECVTPPPEDINEGSFACVEPSRTYFVVLKQLFDFAFQGLLQGGSDEQIISTMCSTCEIRKSENSARCGMHQRQKRCTGHALQRTSGSAWLQMSLRQLLKSSVVHRVDVRQNL
jgi:hypothetical protein